MQDTPYGYCQCGCGQPAPLAPTTNKSRGYTRGQPMRWRHGHAGRKPTAWLEEDRGHSTPCWIWQLSLHARTGYGAKKTNGVSTLAHRAVYEHHVGPIPDGLELDHLCRVRACVNPAHLEPVTHKENVRRGLRDSPTWGTGPAGTTGKSAAIQQDLGGDMTRKAIAAKHGVHRSYVDMIARGLRGPNSRRAA
jgi:hypothetical protein